MQIDKYLKNRQPIIYQTFTNSLKNKTLSHAYLLVGNPGTPLLETAKFLAKTILCDDPSPLACSNCITCLRIESDNYPDVITLDGSKGTIKKDDILNVESRFEKTAFETKGIMIYIIHLVENMTIEAVNSMLKFIEEPEAEVYAFLTTNNINNVLPTIVSRCQTLNLKSVSRTDVINESVEYSIPSEDAELLSYFYNDAELIYELFNNDDEIENYRISKKAVLGLFDSYINGSSKDAIYYEQKEIISLIKTKEEMRFFIDLLSEFFEDLLNKKCGREIILKSYDTILNSLLTKLPHIESSLTELLKQRNLVNLNVNISLQLDHLTSYILKD